jgi:2-polyprenyl-3-methyl-5-hydroxy-6-metoxy-1,4-benzoquinol methylase
MNSVALQTRYYLRKLVYSDGVLGRMARSVRKLAPKNDFDRACWDKNLAGALSPYMGGTLSIDARNALAVVLLQHHAADARTLLDVGCAGGSLARVLPPQYQRYVGIDISEYAVTEAAKRNTRAGCEFHASNLSAYAPTETFDVIVFNEVLYYVEFDCIFTELTRYAQYLSTNGVICVSLKHDPRNEAIYRRMTKDWNYLSGTLYQEKTAPQHRLVLDRQRPAYLTTIWRR